MTLRSLVAMAQARRKHDWQQTSAIMALIYNANRGERSSPVPLDHFDPTRDARSKKPALKMGIQVLDAAFKAHKGGPVYRPKPEEFAERKRG